MTQILLSIYKRNTLQELARIIDNNYYSTLDRLCMKTQESTELLLSLESHTRLHDYLIACNDFISSLQQFIILGRETVIPYLRELDEKNKAGHNCSTCSGNCNVQHNATKTIIQESVTTLSNKLHEMKLQTLKFYNDASCSEHFKTILNKMLLLEALTHEAIELEQDVLLPKIAAAQQNIHVAD